MAKNFEAEAYRIGMRNDLNLLYTLSNLINTLTKIESDDSRELALLSASAICRTASELMRHISGMYEAKDADSRKQNDEADK